MFWDVNHTSSTKIQNILNRQTTMFYMSYSVTGTVIVTTVLTFQSSVISVASAAVLGVIVTDKEMRRLPQYIYAANLAVCGLIIGSFISPFNMPFILYQDSVWDYGKPLCLAWLLVDNVTSSEVPLAVALIIQDRYLFAKYGAEYFIRETAGKSFAKIVATWIWCFVLYGPAILLWEVIQGYSFHPDQVCITEYSEIAEIDMFLSFMELVVPLSLMMFYGFKLARLHFKNKKEKKRKKRSEESASKGSANSDADDPSSERLLLEGVVIYLLFWGPYVAFNFALASFEGNREMNFNGEVVYWYNLAGFLTHPYLFALPYPLFAKRLASLLVEFRCAMSKFMPSVCK